MEVEVREMRGYFVPIPDWLKYEKRVQEPKLFVSFTDFILQCFEKLYRLHFSDRRVVILTSYLWSKQVVGELCIPATNNDIEWYEKNSRFYQAFRSLGDLIESWIDIHLADSPWIMDKFWYLLKIPPEDWESFEDLIQIVKNKFAQHCLGVPETGVWNNYTSLVCRHLQAKVSKTVLPWKNGTLDGFTCKFLAKIWRKRRNIK
jgi:hypothetical protein